jgi:predicted deacylase
MTQLIGILVLILFLLIWFSSVQNFTGGCDDIEHVTIDSGFPGPCLGIIAGVHGNEPAASKLLTRLLESKSLHLDSNNSLLRPIRGKIIVIPRANHCGLENNTRNHPKKIFNLFNMGYDLNRQFNEHGGANGKSNKIIEILKGCDLILDFHEGWGWNITTRNGWGPVSIGSTVFGTSNILAEKVANRATAELNASISDPDKKFVQLFNESCKIPTSLSCHYEKQGRAHVVIETTGQNDIQPLALRQQQVKKVIEIARSTLQI